MRPIEDLKIEKGYWYLATPYSKWKHGLDNASHVACILAGQLLARGVIVYSPIAHSHAISKRLIDVDPRDHDFWLRADKPLFHGAHGLLIATFDGWSESKGVTAEIAWAREHNRPRYLISPETLAHFLLD